jgi:hypothetical protein
MRKHGDKVSAIGLGAGHRWVVNFVVDWVTEIGRVHGLIGEICTQLILGSHN